MAVVSLLAATAVWVLTPNAPALPYHLQNALTCWCRPRYTKMEAQKSQNTANVIKNYFHCIEEQEILEVTVWPPRSPDLNIMESV